jgi:hypothetical protein
LYKAYKRNNPGEAAKVDDYVADITNAAPPNLNTATGDGLVGMIDAGFPQVVTPPPAEFTVVQNVKDGDTITAPIAWSAVPSATVDTVDFFVDGVKKWTEHISPYYFNGDGSYFDPAAVSDGQHELKAVATDAAGKTASATANVTTKTTVTPPPEPTTGLPMFSSKFGPATDSYLNSADATRKAWVKAHHNRGTALPIVYVTNWNSWMNNQKYIDIAAIYNPNHPDHSGAPAPDFSLILKDSNGKPLFIPWGSVVNGQYAQYAADQSNPRWHQIIIDRCKSTIQAGHKGIHFDDVNLPMSLNGTPAAPLNTPNAQKDAVCGLLEAVRAALPNVPVSHNSRWFDSPNHDGNDPYVKRQITAATWGCTIERGLDDSGVHGGTDQWSMNRMFQYVDTVHSLGRSVLWMAYTSATNTAMIEANLAAYWLCRENQDTVCGGGQVDSNWFPLYDLDLGAAKGPRTYVAGVYRREFTKGYVTLTDTKVGRVVKAA